MAPNVKASKVHDNDEIMLDDPIDNPEWWKNHTVTPGDVHSNDAPRVAAAKEAGVPSAVAAWATVDPARVGEDGTPYAVSNIVNGHWASSKQRMNIPNPLNKNKPDVFTIPDTQVDELDPFYKSLRAIPKTGVHNPLKNNHRYVEYGEISRKVSGVHFCVHCVFP